MKGHPIIVSLLVLLALKAVAQDIHFTQFHYTPLSLNPAQTAAFNADYRAIANYKNQWRSIPVPFNTVAASFDMNALQLKNHDRLGAGFSLFRDQAGDSKFTTLQVNASVSYMKSLSADSAHFLSIGAQFGVANRTINTDELYFDNQYDDGFFDPTIPVNEVFQNTGFTFFDVGVGMNYLFMPNQRTQLSVGGGIHHLNRASQSFFDDNSVTLNPRYSMSATGRFKVADRWDLLPGLLFQLQDTKKEVLMSSLTRYFLNPKNGQHIALLSGVYYRWNDAAAVLFGGEYNALSVTVSYDLNVSDLTTASNARGGFEIAVMYLITKVDRITAKGAVCPVF